MKKNFYAVRKGKKCNVIVETWAECFALVNGVSGAIYKGFEFIEDAEKFAESGHYGKFTPKSKPKIRPKKPFGTCLERKSYRDPFTGVFYKNRCVLKYVATTTGDNYKDTGETSVPWN